MRLKCGECEIFVTLHERADVRRSVDGMITKEAGAPMRRKWTAVIALLLIFQAFGALAQGTTREEMLDPDDSARPRTLTLFESMYGYTLWYEADSMVYVAPSNGENTDLFRAGGEKNPEASLSVTMLARAPEDVAEIIWAERRAALLAEGYQIFLEREYMLSAQKGDDMLVLLLRERDRAFYLVRACAKVDRMDAWASRLEAMVDSILPQPALRASYVDDVPFVTPLCEIDRNVSGTAVVIWSDEPLSYIALYDVKLENGEYQRGELIKKLSVKALTEGVQITDVFSERPTLWAEYEDFEGNVHTALIRRAADDTRLTVAVQ